MSNTTEVAKPNTPIMVQSISSHKPDAVWLVEFNRHGRPMANMYFGYGSRPTLPYSIVTERLVGSSPVTAIHDIPAELWGLTPAQLVENWFTLKTREDTTEEDAKAQHEKLRRIDGYIRTSNQEGEVASAKAAWKRLTGKDWVQ